MIAAGTKTVIERDLVTRPRDDLNHHAGVERRYVRRIDRILFESSCFCAAFVASAAAGLIKQAEPISATPPLNGFHAPEVMAAVCRVISHSHVACFLAMFFRNQSPLMSFGASFVSFLVSNEVCLHFPLMLTKMTLKHLFKKSWRTTLR